MSGAHDMQARLARARGYPYHIPARSFVYRDRGPAPFDAALTRGRTPVLAIGSNQSPQRLAQKFGHDARHVIPVQRARLEGFDVVFSAHISSYGAVPAMLQVSPGSRVAVAVTWLDDEQLEIMHETEISAANYSFAALEGITLELDDGSLTRDACVYVSSRGHVTEGGQPVALAAIACERRRFPALTTAQMLERVRARVAPELDDDGFVQRLVEDLAYRRCITDTLSLDAVAFAHPVQVVRAWTPPAPGG